MGQCVIKIMGGFKIRYCEEEMNDYSVKERRSGARKMLPVHTKANIMCRIKLCRSPLLHPWDLSQAQQGQLSLSFFPWLKEAWQRWRKKGLGSGGKWSEDRVVREEEREKESKKRL